MSANARTRGTGAKAKKAGVAKVKGRKTHANVISTPAVRVGRAIQDLRTGLPVVITGTGKDGLLACAAEGWMLRAALPAPLRVVAAVAAILLMVPEALTDLLGLLLALGLVGWMWRAGRERTT